MLLFFLYKYINESDSMSWLDFFQTTSDSNISFGRGTNAAINPQEEELFNLSYEAFENNNMINAYEYFLQSLINFTNNESNDNIIIKKSEDKLQFELFQGTSKVIGKITQEEFYAEMILLKKADATVALKRYILERNYQLTYACYFMDDKYIKLKVFHNNTTMNPQKTFFPIRELALNADFDKEHIKSEFSNISLEDISHLRVVKPEELTLKFTYLQAWIKNLEQKVQTLPSNDATGMQAFLYLNLLFKIDYLLVPKYDIYQKISKKIQEYFSDENLTVEAKNEELKEYVETLTNMSFEEFSNNSYNAKYTFNPTEKTSYEDITNFIDESLIKIRWYKNNRYNQIIPTLYRYIAFYSLYNYGLNPVQRGLLHLLVQIQHASFFKDLGYKIFYENEAFTKRAIISEIETIISSHQSRFKELKPFGSELNFSSMNEFSNSFYLQLKHLNFEDI